MESTNNGLGSVRVFYWSGGTAVGKWCEAFPQSSVPGAAGKLARTIRIAGRVARVVCPDVALPPVTEFPTAAEWDYMERACRGDHRSPARVEYDAFVAACATHV